MEGQEQGTRADDVGAIVLIGQILIRGLHELCKRATKSRRRGRGRGHGGATGEPARKQVSQHCVLLERSLTAHCSSTSGPIPPFSHQLVPVLPRVSLYIMTMGGVEGRSPAAICNTYGNGPVLSEEILRRRIEPPLASFVSCLPVNFGNPSVRESSARLDNLQHTCGSGAALVSTPGLLLPESCV